MASCERRRFQAKAPPRQYLLCRGDAAGSFHREGEGDLPAFALRCPATEEVTEEARRRPKNWGRQSGGELVDST
jgi:hypothetical protein